MTVERFVRDYEIPEIPVMITGFADKWPAFTKWRYQDLIQGPYRDAMLKAGEDDDGYSLKIRLKYYLQYMHSQKDDSPVYLFDSHFDTNPDCKGMIDDFTVPPYFGDDLFNLMGDKRRPPHRWFLIGPERSGTTMHIDPLGTSAWNALLSGHKRWLLMKPGLAKKAVKRPDLKLPEDDNEGITWFCHTLPRIRAEEEQKAREGRTDELLGLTEFIQYPGEIIYVPGDWWHGVVNLDDTIACTQNFAGVNHFTRVWRRTRSGRRHMSRRYLEVLQRNFPPLFERAMALNQMDGFKWQFTDRTAKKKKSKSASSKRVILPPLPAPLNTPNAVFSSEVPGLAPPPPPAAEPTAANMLE